MTNERRRRPRVGWDGEAVARVGMHRICCRGRDLSASGMAVEATWAVYPGRHVNVQLALDGERIDAYGEVTWTAVSQGGYVWGVRFVALHDRCRRRIEAFVDRRTPPSGVRTMLPGVPLPCPVTTTDVVDVGSCPHDRAVDLEGPFQPPASPIALESSTLDFEDRPTHIFHRVMPDVPTRRTELSSPDASGAAVVGPAITGSTVRIAIADVIARPPRRVRTPAAAFACPMPPLLDDSPLDRSHALAVGPSPSLPASNARPACPAQDPGVPTNAPAAVHAERPPSACLGAREHRRRWIEAVLSTNKRRSSATPPDPAERAAKAKASDSPRARAPSDRPARADATPQIRALYEAALRDLHRGP